MTTNTVEKLNESYEALTITPDGSHVGVDLNMDRFFEAYENGIPYDEMVNKATDVAEQGIKESPAVDIASLTNYDIMKQKLAMEVVSIEENADLLNKIPHHNEKKAECAAKPHAKDAVEKSTQSKGGEEYTI